MYVNKLYFGLNILFLGYVLEFLEFFVFFVYYLNGDNIKIIMYVNI